MNSKSQKLNQNLWLWSRKIPKTVYRLRKNLSNLFFLTTFLFLTACPGPRPAFDYRSVQAGKWISKVEIESKEKNENHSLTINFKAIKSDKKVRADVNAILGIHLASVVTDKDSYQALLIKKKIFREGKGQESIIPKDVFGVEIDMRVLPAILFDEAINAVGWVCYSDGKGFLQKCENEKEKMSFDISDRDGMKKKVNLVGEGYTMTFKFDSFAPDEKFSDKTFNLPVPKGFKRM